MRSPRTRCRRHAIVLVALVALLVGAPSALAGPASAEVTSDPELNAAVQAEIAALRADRSTARLSVSAKLQQAALDHATSMGQLGYFSHASADGTSSTRRLASYYPGSGIKWNVGEVMFWSSGTASAQRIVARWVASAPHLREILGKWRDFGSAVVHVDAAPGFFGGQNVTIVVVDFGRR